jgi:Straboviridae polynucleotide kinase
MKPKAFIFDVDGTVARRLERGPYEWDRVGEDEPILWVLEVAKALNQVPETTIIFVSGRDEEAAYQTFMWLDTWFGYGYQLRMRPRGDNRPDFIIKKEILDGLLPHWDIVAAFDDRNVVVDMWRSHNIPCMQVCSREEGDF